MIARILCGSIFGFFVCCTTYRGAFAQCYIDVVKNCQASAPTGGECDGQCNTYGAYCGEGVVTYPQLTDKTVVASSAYVLGLANYNWDSPRAVCGFVTDCGCMYIDDNFDALVCTKGFVNIRDWSVSQPQTEGDACYSDPDASFFTRSSNLLAASSTNSNSLESKLGKGLIWTKHFVGRIVENGLRISYVESRKPTSVLSTE